MIGQHGLSLSEVRSMVRSYHTPSADEGYVERRNDLEKEQLITVFSLGLH